MQTQGIFETYQVKLKTHSFLSIQNQGKDRGPIVYHGGRGYYIDEDALLDFLYSEKEELVDPYLEWIKKGCENAKFIRKYESILLPFIYRFKKDIYVGERGGRFVRTHCGKTGVYVPGSSLKGAIRTAIMYSVIESNPQLKQRTKEVLTTKIEDYDRERDDKKRETFAKELMEIIFQGYCLKLHADHKVSVPSPFTDFLRAVKVFDGQVHDPRLASPKLCLLHLQEGGASGYRARIKRFETQVECLRQKSEVIFKMTIDRRLLQEFQTRTTLGDLNLDLSFEGIWRMVDAFAKQQWAYEEQIFNQITTYDPSEGLDAVIHFYRMSPGDRALIRLGYGSGLFGTTVDLLLKGERIDRGKLRRKPLLKVLRDVVLLTKHGEQRPLPVPKTRRLVVFQNPESLSPLGWCTIVDWVQVSR